MNKEKGSILILTILSVLVLTISVIGLLNIGSTEQFTTQNFMMSKKAYYHCLQGQEEMIDYCRTNADPTGHSVAWDTKVEKEGVVKKDYRTGDLESSKSLGEFQGFYAPPPVSMTLNPEVVPMVYDIPVVSEVGTYSKKAYAEISSGVYKIMTH